MSAIGGFGNTQTATILVLFILLTIIGRVMGGFGA